MCVEKVIKNRKEHFLESLFLREKCYIVSQKNFLSLRPL